MFKKLSTIMLTLCMACTVACGEEDHTGHDHAGHDHAKKATTQPAAATNPVDVAEKALDPAMTSQQQASYGIGFSIGKQVAEFAAHLDMDALIIGLKDSVSNQEPKVSQQQFQAAFAMIQAKMQEKTSAEGKVNIEAGKTFLEANGKKEGVKTTDSGLQYTITKEGTGKSPAATDTVRVHYKGTLLDGTQFDSSYDRGEPAEFPLNGVIPGWTEGLQLLKEGGKATLWIPSDLAYGPQGRSSIPPSSTLIFEVELLEVK